MPTPINLSTRETVDLHAPWWSDAKDEHGRYVERCVVFAQMSERDNQVISQQVAPKVRGGGRNAEISMREIAFARRFTLLRMVTELTNAQGQPLPITGQLIDSLPSQDVEFIANELDRLNGAPVSPTDEDVAEAERNAEAGLTDDDRVDAQRVAERHFRPRR